MGNMHFMPTYQSIILFKYPLWQYTNVERDGNEISRRGRPFQTARGAK